MANAQPFPIDIPGGVVKSTSNLSARGRWTGADKVRFVNGRPEKWGGWDLLVDEQMDGLARGALGWTASSKQDLLATGTFRKLYSIDDMINDITPLQSSGTLGADPFTMVNTSAVVTVGHTAHGLEDRAKVHFSGAIAGRGITINGEYEVTVVDANSYTITHSAPATSSGTGGGGAVAYEYEINPGAEDAVYGLGAGAGPVGEGTVGTPRTSGGISLDMAYWSISRYGAAGTALILANRTGAGIYLWDEPAGDDRAEVLAGAPASVRYAFVTAERYIFALGCDDRDMLLRWPARDDPTDWNPDLADDGNARTMQDGNKLMAGCVFNDAINLFWSDTAIYAAQYQEGSDFIYATPVLKTQCGLVGQGAFCVTPVGVIWVSQADILLFDGSVQPVTNFGDLRSWFFRNMRAEKAHKITCTFNAKKNEVLINYPSINSTENDSYLSVSLDGFFWAPGTMAGDWGVTAAATLDSPGKRILAAHADGYVYEHEVGSDADGAILPAYIEHGIVALANGKTDMDLFGYQPDCERQTGNLTLKVSLYDRPRNRDDDDPVDEQEYTIADTDGLIDMSMGGRFAKSRITSNALGGDFRLGIPQFEIAQAGESR